MGVRGSVHLMVHFAVDRMKRSRGEVESETPKFSVSEQVQQTMQKYQRRCIVWKGAR